MEGCVRPRGRVRPPSKTAGGPGSIQGTGALKDRPAQMVGPESGISWWRSHRSTTAYSKGGCGRRRSCL